MKAAKLGVRVGAIALLGVSTYTRWPMLCSSQTVHAFNKAPNQEPLYSYRWNPNWDRRDPRGYVEAPRTQSASDMAAYKDRLRFMTPVASRHLLLVRHGQYVETAPLDEDRVLTELGKTQANFTGQRLKELSLPYKGITVSTMTRAQETARLIHTHVPKLQLISDPSLSEGAPAVPDPLSGNWWPTPDQFFQDGARIENAFRKYFHRADPDQAEDSYELIVCHSNVIRYFICRALQFPIEAWIRVSVANCSMTLLTIHPDGTVVMEMMGDHGHMPPESVSFH